MASELADDDVLPPYCCAILLCSASGELLLEWRPASAAVAAGKLTCFGGKREPGETAAHCLLRELREELNWAPVTQPRRVVDLFVEGRLIAYFYVAEAPRRDEQLRLEAGREAVRLQPADALRDERLSEWHAAVLRAWQRGATRADFPEHSSATPPAALVEMVLENADLVHPAPEDRPPSVSPFDAACAKPLLWLGNRKVAESREALRLMRVTHVVNCAPSQVGRAFDSGAADAPAYCDLDLNDAPVVHAEAADGASGRVSFDARARECFERGAAYISAALAQPGAVVYVHCAGGVSRSASVVLAYLVTRGGLPLRDAWRQVKAQREVIGPNAGFFGVLLDLEREALGRETMARPINMQQRCFRELLPA